VADRTESYPESATHGARRTTSDGEGEAALRGALDEHGEDLAAAVAASDELADVLATAVLIVASADETEIEYVTESSANLVEAVDGLTTAEAAALAGQVGENGDELSATLETVLELERAGHTDDLVRIASAFSESLSPAEVEELATMFEEHGSEMVDAVDVLLDLAREDHLEDLVDLAAATSALEIEPAAIEGANTVLAAVGDAQREAEPVGLLGLLAGLRGRDARAGMGYLLALLRAQGRRFRER